MLDKRIRLIASIKNGRIQKMEQKLNTEDDSNLKVGKRIIDVDELAENLFSIFINLIFRYFCNIIPMLCFLYI